ncbi:hypothetical protein BH24ACI1_BH24ACI1_03260 [soil metagenome]|jgi:protein-S-isoprenylcysteine O-methyltransferase Ste14|nr:carboxypeptidase-like regulatory domain-containing protein [Pyrinomonadaceae bacterium]
MFREKKAVFRVFLLSALFISGIISVVAQVDTASVTGQITDPQGAVIAGARVLITNQATRTVRRSLKVKTDWQSASRLITLE